MEVLKDRFGKEILAPGRRRIVRLHLRRSLPAASGKVQKLAAEIADMIRSIGSRDSSAVDGGIEVEEWVSLFGGGDAGLVHRDAVVISALWGYQTFALHEDDSAFLLAIRQDSMLEQERRKMEKRYRVLSDALKKQVSGLRPACLMVELYEIGDASVGREFWQMYFSRLADELGRRYKFLHHLSVGVPYTPFRGGWSATAVNPHHVRTASSALADEIAGLSEVIEFPSVVTDWRRDWRANL